MKRFICVILILSSIMLCGCGSTAGQDVPIDTAKTSSNANTTKPSQSECTEPIKPKDYPSGVDFDFSKYRKNIPDVIYTTPASENGLAGTLYQITGTVENIQNVSGFDCYFIRTEHGDVAVGTGIEAIKTNDFIYERLYENKFDSYYKMPEIGEYVSIYAEYSGFSGVLNLPSFTYGGEEYLIAAISNSIRQSDIENEFFANEDRVETFCRLMSSCSYQELKGYIDAFILEGQCPEYDDAYHLSAQLDEIIALVKNCHIEVDNVEKCAKIYYKGVTEISRNINVLPFVETSDYGAVMDITLGFVRNDWLFFDRIYFASDSTETEYFSFGNTVRDVLGGGTIYESASLGSSAALMKICKDSTPIIRFKNSDTERYLDHELTSKEIDALLLLEHIRDLHDEIWDSLSEWENGWSGHSAFTTSP